MKNCPYCSEEIQEDAKKCKHCGEWLNKTPSSNIVKKKPWYRKWWGLLIILIFTMYVLGGMFQNFEEDKSSSSSNNSKTSTSRELTTGTEVTTKKMFAVCKYYFYLEELIKYSKHSDVKAAEDMLNKGHCFELPSNTRVIIEEINYSNGTVGIRRHGKRETLWTFYSYLK